MGVSNFGFHSLEDINNPLSSTFYNLIRYLSVIFFSFRRKKDGIDSTGMHPAIQGQGQAIPAYRTTSYVSCQNLFPDQFVSLVHTMDCKKFVIFITYISFD